MYVITSSCYKELYYNKYSSESDQMHNRVVTVYCKHNLKKVGYFYILGSYITSRYFTALAKMTVNEE
jgi:hypothetical protein